MSPVSTSRLVKLSAYPDLGTLIGPAILEDQPRFCEPSPVTSPFHWSIFQVLAHPKSIGDSNSVVAPKDSSLCCHRGRQKSRLSAQSFSAVYKQNMWMLSSLNLGSINDLRLDIVFTGFSAIASRTRVRDRFQESSRSVHL